MILSVTLSENGIVTLLSGQKHGLEDSDHVLFKDVKGLVHLTSPGESINGSVRKVTVINANSFSIGDTRMFGPYERDGTCKLVKMPVKLTFQSLETVLESPVLDPQMSCYDFLKLDC